MITRIEEFIASIAIGCAIGWILYVIIYWPTLWYIKPALLFLGLGILLVTLWRTTDDI